MHGTAAFDPLILTNVINFLKLILFSKNKNLKMKLKQN